MKKIVVMISLLLIGAALYANPVTPEKALQVASRVFASAPATKATDASSLQIIWDGEFEPATKAAQDPAYYVVSRPGGGFVIVSGNDNVQPVLAFSFENEFKVEGMPSNVRWWMEELKGYARSAVRPTPEIEEAWEAYAETKSEISGDLVKDMYTISETNLWNQNGPANLSVPKVSVQTYYSVCGCVPLAIAEIMAWFGAYNKTTLDAWEIPSYTYWAYYPGSEWDSQRGYFNYEQTIDEHNLTTSHSWASLQTLHNYTDFTAEASTALGADLGKLVYDIGTILQVEYNQNEDAGGTGGNLGLLNVLTTRMFYNKAATIKRRENYTAKEWIDMLVSEIHEHPVFYDGQDTGNKGGHAFVADGYATMKEGGNKVIHFNFGWGGTCNGYYNCLTDVATANGYNFFNENSALFGFVPDVAGETGGNYELGFFFDGTKGGVSLNPATDNAKVHLDLNNLVNSGSVPFNEIYIAAFKVDKNGVLGDAPLNFVHANFSDPVLVGMHFDHTNWQVNHLASPVLGDKYSVCYSFDGSYYYPIEKASSGKILTELPYYPAAFIKKAATYKVGDDFVFELTNHDYRYGDATWTISKLDSNGEIEGTPDIYSQGDHKVQFTQAGWYMITVSTPGQETITAYIQVTAS